MAEDRLRKQTSGSYASSGQQNVYLNNNIYDILKKEFVNVCKRLQNKQNTSISKQNKDAETSNLSYSDENSISHSDEKSLSSGEERFEGEVTVPISFRVRDVVYMKYRRFGKEKKRVLKEIVERAIEALAGEEVTPQTKILNLNLNVNVAEAKAENVNINLIKQELEVLKQENRILKKRLELCRQSDVGESVSSGEGDKRLKQLLFELNNIIYRDSSKYVSKQELLALISKYRGGAL